MTNELLAWCLAEQLWLREVLDTLVRLESPSTDKAAVDRCGDELVRRLAALGASTAREAGGARGDHVLARFGDGPASLLLLGHLDTVWPIGQIERMPVREKDGRLYGPGVFDMKAGIAVGMLAVRAIAELRLRNVAGIAMLFTTDEEIGSGTSRSLIETVARECGAVLVLEPSLPGGAAKTSRKGCVEIELIVHGISAHAGVDPEKGASAVHELAHQISVIAAMDDPGRGVSVNVGRISGGTRSNVVAELARAWIDVRVPTAMDAATIEHKLKALRPRLRGIRLELAGAGWRPPLERTAGVVELYRRARAAAAALGQDLGEGGTGGGSDGNFTAAAGVPTLDGLGPRGGGAHALHEHVELEDLPWRAAFLATLMTMMARPGGSQDHA
jgi:glutamate carboxypeptidase